MKVCVVLCLMEETFLSKGKILRDCFNFRRSRRSGAVVAAGPGRHAHVRQACCQRGSAGQHAV